jgi:DNA replication and repair protein RecF
MKIKKLSLRNYRGYQSQEIDFGEGVHLFIGQNGSGKTNLLEAIYFLSLAKSYKTDDENLIRFNQDFSRIDAHYDSKDKGQKIRIIITKNKKKIILNGHEIQRLSDYIGQFNVVSFLPEDMQLIKGPPRHRRYFIDSMIGQMDKNYLIELSQYKKILKERNETIKTLSEHPNPDMTLLDIYTEQLAESANNLMFFRKRFIDDLNHHIKTIHPYLSNQDNQFKFIYLPSIQSHVEKTLKEQYRKDLFSKTTTSGPHRDDYQFKINGSDAKDLASQGEQRIMILSLLLSITKIIYAVKKEQPILLLDDVFSELDALRQNKLIHFLNQSNLQTIITTTTTDHIENNILNDSNLYNVKNHFIRRHKHE